MQYDDAAYRQAIRRNAGWNFWVNVGDLSFVTLAGSFVFISTILPLYASYLTDSRILIGLIPATYLVASHGPQLFMAARAEALGRKKPWVVRVSVFERVPWLILGLGILLWPEAPAWFSYAFLAAMLLAAQGAVGVASPAWRAMLANVVHPDRKGLMFGLGSSFGGLMGAAGALLARYILDTVAFPRSFGLCFVLAFAGQALSWTFLTLNREPERPPDRPRARLGSYLRELPEVLRQDANFARFLISQVLVILGTLGVSFYVVYGREAFGVSDSFAATLTMVGADQPGPGHAAAGLVGRPLRPPLRRRGIGPAERGRGRGDGRRSRTRVDVRGVRPADGRGLRAQGVPPQPGHGPGCRRPGAHLRGPRHHPARRSRPGCPCPWRLADRPGWLPSGVRRRRGARAGRLAADADRRGRPTGNAPPVRAMVGRSPLHRLTILTMLPHPMKIEEIATSEAKTHLSALLNQVLAGKSFYLTRRGKRIAELSPVTQPTGSRRAGFAKGTFTYIALDFDAPLDDFADYQ